MSQNYNQAGICDTARSLQCVCIQAALNHKPVNRAVWGAYAHISPRAYFLSQHMHLRLSGVRHKESHPGYRDEGGRVPALKELRVFHMSGRRMNQRILSCAS